MILANRFTPCLVLASASIIGLLVYHYLVNSKLFGNVATISIIQLIITILEIFLHINKKIRFYSYAITFIATLFLGIWTCLQFMTYLNDSSREGVIETSILTFLQVFLFD
jgi:hypothetical protein